MSNLLRPIRHIVQNWKLNKLAKKAGVGSPRKSPTIFRNNPVIVNLVLLEIDENNEMSALLFDWNDLGFNDTAIAGCRNGVAVQTKAAVVANLVANGATNYKNKDILFTFRDGDAIELGVKMLMPI
ncbi:unnamed protein product [Rhizophagus irregularis]|uniref:Uncharacterized protein n=1 Tax=Rhizophagus irregularis TaxID=588596 RepID=A0A2N1MF50_9GLOM|nr:hypothetical protein RhiirC2_793708 [Rhizophagus irregularis]CAB4394000.1 unnamed protein product [Rhizophagus irregularis]CAB5386907.1 unnamed protein product [Rhizophagus irregularis]